MSTLLKPKFTINQDCKKFFSSQFDFFLIGRKKVVFAYSGGLDSTVVLHLLNNLCKERGLRLVCFTVNHGFKGTKTMENIKRVINFEGLNDSYYLLDISDMLVSKGVTVMDYFADFCKKNIVPCGVKCNKIVHGLYKKVLDDFGENYLITGGDTPIWDEGLENYSIFWNKQGYIVVRGGVVFGLTKEKNKQFIKSNKVPWKDPGCGGYDTDCLIPGGILRGMVERGDSVDQIHKAVPQIKEYLENRKNVGVIDNNQFVKGMKKISFSNDESFVEFRNIIFRNRKK